MAAKTCFGIAVLMGASAIPGYCSAILSFGGTLGGTIKVIGSGFSQSLDSTSTFALSGYSTLTVVGAPTGNTTYALTNTSLNYNYSTKVLTLLGAISSLAGLSAQSTLLTINYSSPLLADDHVNTALTLNLFNNVTSITESSQLLTDLGFNPALTASSLPGTPAIGGTGTGVLSGGDYTFTANSGTIAAQVTATPEPASFAMIGGGLLALGCFKFRRRQTA